MRLVERARGRIVHGDLELYVVGTGLHRAPHYPSFRSDEELAAAKAALEVLRLKYEAGISRLQAGRDQEAIAAVRALN